MHPLIKQLGVTGTKKKKERNNFEKFWENVTLERLLLRSSTAFVDVKNTI